MIGIDTGWYSVGIYKDRSDIYCSIKYQLRAKSLKLPYLGVKDSYYVGFTEPTQTITIFFTNANNFFHYGGGALDNFFI